jgi:hypothetical protein
MNKSFRRLGRRFRLGANYAAVMYIVCSALFVLATAPAWRVFAFGLTLEDFLQLRCF